MPTKRDLVRQHITEFPNVKSKKERGRMLNELYPEKTAEKWRQLICKVTGSAGDYERDIVKDPEKTKFFYNGFQRWAEQNLNVEQAPWDEPFIIPISIKQLNIIADLHSVHMDPAVMTAFLRSAKDKEAVLLNGDLMDSESLSRHLRGHNVIEYEKEIELCHKILKGLKEEFTHVYYKHGNHCFWLERYLLINAREVFRVLGLDLNSLLRTGELGVHTIHNLKYWQYGDLDGVHGHEFPGFGLGKFPAKGLWDKWQTFKHSYSVKVIGSHCHRSDHSVSPKSKTGQYSEGWITPAMCRKGATYAPYPGWENGWTTAKINNDGKTEVELTVL